LRAGFLFPEFLAAQNKSLNFLSELERIFCYT
jgi:hypothetical protein